MAVRRIAIEAVSRSGPQLAMAFSADGLAFHTTTWYEGVDLGDLERRFGARYLHKVYFHIAAFELLKLVSLRPAVADLGPFRALHTDAFELLWRRVLDGVWGQWRYENDAPDYRGPALASTPVPPHHVPEPAATVAGDVDVLAFVGGGKDSLVAAKLLERGGVRYASLAYAHDSYGAAAPQHALIDALVDRCAPARRHRLWIRDDFVGSPVARLTGHARTVTAAETPTSIFAAVPLALAHGYRWLALAHEASANEPNLVWDATGEPINHQWGKSYDAQRLVDAYLASELVADLRYVSPLQPVHDPVVFYLLNRDRDAVAATHSCNITKPWCWRCAKCAYVWLGYMAYLPRAAVEPLLAVPILSSPATRPAFRQLMGLAERTPFECVGTAGETHLALALARARGWRGDAIDLFEREIAPIDVAAACDRYLSVAGDRIAPGPIRDTVLPQLQDAARDARAHIEEMLS
ncbi:MAG: hypothetical protein D6689_04370 [Deltaproteobacteria bacterium]|nr:MAG: hypothetical protein D6689_04370 [Deltaproteobacteria bacterium]